MKARDLIELGTKHVRNALSEELYLRTGRDTTRPASIFAEVVTVACDKLCLFTCLAQRTLADKLKMGLTLLSGNDRVQKAEGRAAEPTAAP